MGSPVIFSGRYAKLLPPDGIRTSGALNLVPGSANYLSILDGADLTKGIKFDTSGITSGAILTIEAVNTVGVTITLPDNNAYLVGRDTVDLLTNKHFNDAITMTEIVAPSTPSAGNIALWADTSTALLFKDSGGNSHSIVDYTSGSGATMGNINILGGTISTSSGDMTLAPALGGSSVLVGGSLRRIKSGGSGSFLHLESGNSTSGVIVINQLAVSTSVNDDGNGVKITNSAISMSGPNPNITANNEFDIITTSGDIVLEANGNSIRLASNTRLAVNEVNASESGGVLNLTSGSRAVLYRVTSAATGTISTITNFATTGDQVIVLNNATGSNLIIANTTTAGTSEVVTGTGGDITLSDEESITLIHSSGEGKWLVVGGVDASGDNDNFILNPSAETSTTGWAAYANTAGTAPTTGTGGSPSVTITRTTTTPLSGIASFLLTKDAANRQGNGVSYLFEIDRASEGQVCTIEAAYKIDSGTFASGDVAVYIVDVDYGTVIQPSGYQVLNTTINGKISATFQTSVASGGADSRKYRLCLHVASTSASAYTLKFDDVKVSPQVIPQGPVMSDPINAGVTSIGATTTAPTKGTTGTDKVTWRRIGNKAEITWEYRQTGAGSAGSGTYLLNMPSGLAIDISSTGIADPSSSTTTGRQTVVGHGSLNFGTTEGSLELHPYSSTQLFAFSQLASAPAAGLWSSTFFETVFTNSAGGFSATAIVPIAGWSSNSLVSSSAETRVVLGSAARTGSQFDLAVGSGTFRCYTPVLNTTIANTHGTLSLTGSDTAFTVPVPGFYRVVFRARFASATDTVCQYYIEKNGSAVSNAAALTGTVLTGGIMSTVNTDGRTLTINYEGPFVAGDVIRPQILRYSNNLVSMIQDSAVFSVELIQGPAQIAASESIICTYDTATSGTLTGSGIDIKYTNKVIDTHAAYNTSTGEFTAPAPGKYSINAALRCSTTAMTVGHGTALSVLVNGSPVKYIVNYRTQTATGIIRELFGSPVIIPLLAGDKVKILGSTDTNTAIDTGAFVQTNFNWISINRVGN